MQGLAETLPGHQPAVLERKHLDGAVRVDLDAPIVRPGCERKRDSAFPIRYDTLRRRIALVPHFAREEAGLFDGFGRRRLKSVIREAVRVLLPLVEMSLNDRLPALALRGRTICRTWDVLSRADACGVGSGQSGPTRARSC